MRRMLNKTRPTRVGRRDVEPLERRVLLSAAALAADAEVYDGHTYVLIGRSGLDWAAAEAQAREMGGHLVTINDTVENQFVAGFIARRLGNYEWMWIGLTDDPAYGGHEAGDTHASPYPPAGNRGEGWVWASGEPVTFQNWAAGEPNNDGPQNYGIINYGGIGLWDDSHPSLVSGAVVEIPSTQPPPYEAERASITGAGVSATHSGFTGTGYVDFSHAAGDSVEFAVDAPAAGRFELGFRYANGGTSTRSLGLWVNGAAVPGGATFAPTGSWRTWNAVPTAVPLVAGANKVRLLATGQSGPNLDSLSIAPVTPPESVTYQAESARLSGAVAASDVPGYTGSGFADYQHGTADYVEFPVEVPADGSYALDFRYANGGRYDRPLDLRVDGRLVTRLSFGPTGTWRTWKTRTQTVLLNVGRHTVRLTAAGRSGPNLDALTVQTERASIPPPAGMTGWWTGDGNASDIVGGRNGVFRGGATTGPGLVDGAFVLDGEDDFIDVPDDAALDAGTRDFTVDLWVYFNDTDGEQVLVEKWVQGESFPSGWILTKLENDVIRFALARSDRGEENVDSRPLAIPPLTWNHFAATRRGDTATVYRNGEVIARNTEVGDCSVDTPSSLKFGHRGSPEDTPGSVDERGFYLNGRADEVELFIGTALSQEQVRAIYEAGPAGKTKG